MKSLEENLKNPHRNLFQYKCGCEMILRHADANVRPITTADDVHGPKILTKSIHE